MPRGRMLSVALAQFFFPLALVPGAILAFVLVLMLARLSHDAVVKHEWLPNSVVEINRSHVGSAAEATDDAHADHGRNLPGLA